MYGVNPLGDCLIGLLKKLYCEFTNSICDSPCPSALFEYLLKYSPEYNNSIKSALQLRPLVCDPLRKFHHNVHHDNHQRLAPV